MPTSYLLKFHTPDYQFCRVRMNQSTVSTLSKSLIFAYPPYEFITSATIANSCKSMNWEEGMSIVERGGEKIVTIEGRAELSWNGRRSSDSQTVLVNNEKKIVDLLYQLHGYAIYWRRKFEARKDQKGNKIYLFLSHEKDDWMLLKLHEHEKWQAADLIQLCSILNYAGKVDIYQGQPLQAGFSVPIKPKSLLTVWKEGTAEGGQLVTWEQNESAVLSALASEGFEVVAQHAI